MALKVPVIDAPSVALRPIGAQFQQLDARGAFGEGIAEGLGQVAKGLEGPRREFAAVEERRRSENRAASIAAAEAAFDQHANRTLYDPEKGFLAQQGVNAVSSYKGVNEDLEKKFREIEEHLPDEETKRLFRTHAAGSLQSARRNVETHTTRQGERVRDDAFKARDNAFVQSNALSFSDPEERKRQWDGMQGHVLWYAKSQGMDAAATEELLRETKARGVEAALGGYLAQNDGRGAKAFFDEHSEELGVRAQRYEKQIGEMALANEVEGLSKAIMTEAKVPGYQWTDARWAFERVEKIADPKLKEETRRLVEHQVAKAEREKQRAGFEQYNKALALYLQRGTLASPEIQKIHGWMLDPNNGAAELWDKLQDKVRGDADYWRRLREHRQGETPEQRLENVRLQVDMAQHPDTYAAMAPDEFAVEWAHRLSPTDFGSRGRDLATLHQDKTKPAAALQTPLQVIVNEGQRAGAFPNKDNPGAWQPEEYARFEYVAKAYETEKPKPENLRQWAAEKFAKGRVVGGGVLFGDSGEVTRVEAATKERYRGKPFQTLEELGQPAKAPSSETGELLKIAEEIRAKGYEPTGNVVEWVTKERQSPGSGGPKPTLVPLGSRVILRGR